MAISIDIIIARIAISICHYGHYHLQFMAISICHFMAIIIAIYGH